MFQSCRPGSLLRKVGVGLGLLFFCFSQPAAAFQVKITAPFVMLKPQPDQRSGPDIERLAPQWALLLDTGFALDGELWCKVAVNSRHTGWIPARFVDPGLRNQPLTLMDLPGPLVFDFAERELIYKTALNDPAVKAQLRRWTLAMELALVKEHWSSTRERLNFLDISRRIGVRISDQEYGILQQELRRLEQKFQQVLGQWQRS